MRHVTLPLLCLTLLASRAQAQRVRLKTLTDVEMWKTDSGSRLLTRNFGAAQGIGRVRGFLVYHATGSLELRAVGEVQGTTGVDGNVETELELLSARWQHSRAFMAEGGRILLPLGEFGSRRFSNTNPLIGSPDLYPGEYPWGAQVGGAVGALDYRAALVSLPTVNERYTPAPSNHLRPVAGLGLTLGPQLRFGAGFTHGPYLGSSSSAKLPIGKAWQDYNQTVLVGDARVSVGYFDARFEAAWSSYQVPTVAKAVHGLGWYGELRATLSPRWFVAGRFEHNDYPFVLAVSPAFWVGTKTLQMNGEAGVGFRWSTDALIKASLRKDHWPVHLVGTTAFPDGYAFAVQVSLHTSVNDLLGPH